MKSFILLASLCNIAFAADPYFEIKEVRIREVPVRTGANKVKDRLDLVPNTFGTILQMTTDLVALGEKIYPIIKASRPQLRTNLAPISVVPVNQGNIDVDVDNWKGPVVRKFEFVMENMLGLDAVTFTYRVHFYYGGSVNGQGQYLKGFAIIPDYIQVLPGYDLDVNLRLIEIVNKGTSPSPVAALTAALSMKVDGPIDLQEFTHTFEAEGSGILRQFL